MISQRLSGAMEDCSIVRGWQLRTLCHQRCCMSASLCMPARCGTQSPLTSIGDKTAVVGGYVLLTVCVCVCVCLHVCLSLSLCVIVSVCKCAARENLNRDKYLLTQMDRDQWVPIQIVAGFNQVRKMTNRLELVVDVLRGEFSSLIWGMVPACGFSRTLYVYLFPLSVTRYLSPCGARGHCRISPPRFLAVKGDWIRVVLFLLYV